MFHKDGSSTLGGKKDAPLRKSDRRKLRDSLVDALFIGDASSPTSTDGWIGRAEKLIDDAILAPKGGDVLSRKLKLPGGEHATLFLRTPAAGPLGTSSSSFLATKPSTTTAHPISEEQLFNSYPIAWPYYQTTQPIVMEYEDTDRKVHLIPLLALLAALPPPLPSSPLLAIGANDTSDTTTKKYRIPNIAIHPQVSKYICRGADLMRSGIRSFPSPWELRSSKGLVTISILGNPQPVAIGFIEKSLLREYCYSKNGFRDWRLDASNSVGMGKKGVGVTVVNCYGDDLWRSASTSKVGAACAGDVTNPLGGGRFDDGNYGNAGFLEGKVVCPILAVDDDSSDGEQDDGETVPAAELEQLTVSEQEENKTTTSSGATHQNDEDDDSKPDHDDILSSAFYTSLLQLLASKTALPIPVSTYSAKHLMAAVPSDGPRLDMKKTTHKKIGPFLLEKEKSGVVKLGASKDKKDKCAFLVEVVKNHPDLVDFKRKWKKEIEESGGTATLATAPLAKKMAVVDLYIVPRHVSDGMQLDKGDIMAVNAKTEERRGTGFLTKTECRALIEQYIEDEELVDLNGKGRVLVNGPLCDALYRVSKKNKDINQQAEYPTSVKRKDLIEKWLARMEVGHAVVEMPGSTILHLGRGEPKPVDIEVEFRQGNKKKFLTRLRGMEEYGIDAEALSNDVSHRFACSSSVETNPLGRPALKKGRAELVFQGHLSEELTALLTGDDNLSTHGGAKGAEYNLPKSIVKVTLRKGVPARKRR
ncbi:predicted protein [Thalassiosira pseudonana CCMP1335]|uniref:SUI1 domain-containing protein n=1 Tax=Thalassiosira pseudonana TaxID=35128 RepID=B8C821_THAPS|nr:predicted protein [Thalassiosira pseudonana CCMP1335]EED90413.1 predicted protein [Thalassiosira pseudonana CCMP1335]